MPLSLSTSQQQYLRGLAHKLKPVILVGSKGITEPLVVEVNRALDDHELLKVRLNIRERDERVAAIDSLLAQLDKVHKVQVIGHALVLYRPASNPVIQLPRR